MAAEISSQSNASTEDEWRTRLQEIEEIVRRLGSKEKSTTDSVDSSSQMADSRKESKGRTLLLKIHLLRYSISWEELDCLFARFGRIECIEVFCPGEQYHSRIRFQQKESTIRAFESFNHRDIYDGCCRLELFLKAEIDVRFQEPKNWTPPHISEHRSTTTSSSESWERRMRMQENLRKMEALVKKMHEEPCWSKVQASTDEEEGSVEESLLDEESKWSRVEEIADKNQEITPPLSSYVDSTDGYDEPFSDIEEGLQEIDASGVDKNRMGVPIADQKQELTVSIKAIDSTQKFKSPQIESFSRGTFSNPYMILSQRNGEFLISDRLSSRLNKLHRDSKLENSWIAMEFSETLGSKAAHNVFVEMLETNVESMWGTYAVIGKPGVLDKNLIFDPGGKMAFRLSCICCDSVVLETEYRDVVFGLISYKNLARDGSIIEHSVFIQDTDLKLLQNGLKSLPFDRGRRHIITLWVNPKTICVVQAEKPIPAVTLNFDPGGEMAFMLSCICCASVHLRGDCCHRRSCASVLGKGWCITFSMVGSDNLGRFMGAVIKWNTIVFDPGGICLLLTTGALICKGPYVCNGAELGAGNNF